jgi:outer membrane protein
MKKAFLIGALSLLTICVQAQNSKTAYLSVERVMILMPEVPGIRSEMQEFQSKINSQIQAKYEALQSKIAAYRPIAEDLGQERRLELEKEIQNLDQDLQKYRADGQEASARKENKLMQPVYKRIQEAIDAVAKAAGYEQVFRAETMLYTGNSDDVFELVLTELKIEIPESSDN